MDRFETSSVSFSGRTGVRIVPPRRALPPYHRLQCLLFRRGQFDVATSLGCAGEPAMSDLEFQRELSPEQIREALSLLDSTTGAQNQNLRIGDLSPGEERFSCAAGCQAST